MKKLNLLQVPGIVMMLSEINFDIRVYRILANKQMYHLHIAKYKEGFSEEYEITYLRSMSTTVISKITIIICVISYTCSPTP